MLEQARVNSLVSQRGAFLAVSVWPADVVCALQGSWGLWGLLLPGSFASILTVSLQSCLMLYLCQTSLWDANCPHTQVLCASAPSAQACLPHPFWPAYCVSLQTGASRVLVSRGPPLCWHAHLFTVIGAT